jgi:predicted dehydrogenase
MNSEVSRRDFLKSSAVASFGLTLGARTLTARSYGNIMGANERVQVAVIGLRNRGLTHIQSINASPNAVVTHVCDVDQRYLEAGANTARELFGRMPKKEKDIRKLLKSADIDAITIATPEHWHTPMTLISLQAGKHVYVEKPPAHNPAECDMLVKAQQKYGLHVQMGNQQRSSIHTQEAIQKIQEGIVGTPYFSKTWYCNQREGIGFGQITPVPDYLDWELWQGPAPRKPYKDNIHPYNWHWFWNWGTGETLNNATHEIDLSVWAFQVGLPDKISAIGGRYHFRDDWEFYDTLNTSFEYNGKLITWEGKSCNNLKTYNRGRGVVIHGTEGSVLIDRNGYEVYDLAGKKTFVYEKKEQDATTGLSGEGPMTDAHFRNFIDAIRVDEPLHAPIAEGNVSVTMLLLSNIAWKMGRVLNLDPKTGIILNDHEAMKLWQREYEPGWEPVI